MQRKIDLHIIGGCMLGQKALGLSNLFYRKFAAQLQESFGVQCNIQLDGHNDFEILPNKALAIPASPDTPRLLILQLRPALIFRRCNLLAPVRKKGGIPFQLNPYVTGNKKGAITTANISMSDEEMGAMHMTNGLHKMVATINALSLIHI